MSVALSLILLSAAVHAAVNILTKQADDKYAMRLLIGVFSALMVAPFLTLVPLPWGGWPFLLATALIHAFYELLLVRSYESAAFSAVYPVARGTGPLFTAVGAVLLLGEKPPPLRLLGIALVCTGVVGIGFSYRAGSEGRKGLAFALATGFTIGAYTLVDASGVRSVADPFSYVLWFFIAHGLSLASTAPVIRGRAVLAGALRQARLGALAAFLSIVTYGSAMLAYRYGATAQLAALRETSVLFGTVLALIFLGETVGWRRVLAAIAIAAGAVLLATG